jgi:hypothetical protein
MELPDPVVDIKALPQTGHQAFMLVALTQTGRVLVCGDDYAWVDVTPEQANEREDQGTD